MKLKMQIYAVAGIFVASVAVAGGQGDPKGQGANTNWGKLTSGAIADGFPQGQHSSDPSGDAHGPGTADEPRAGLANVVEQGNLGATVELIESLLP